ncbi:MAG: hypothetical protein HY554_10050 [Elusimicrobia bacterium]|nr:hypothetical protein [Elusimicrobiota bacterium]
MKALREDAGVVLIHVLVLAVILGMLASGLLRLSLNRSVVAAQAQRGLESRAIGEAALLQAWTCLFNNAWDGGCGSVPPPCAKFFAGGAEVRVGDNVHRGVRLRLSAGGPGCRIEGVVQEPAR